MLKICARFVGRFLFALGDFFLQTSNWKGIIPMSDHTELKRLQVQLSRERDSLDSVKKDVNEAKQKISQHENRINSLKKNISRITEGEKKVIVSEHAILRYFERVLGFDINDIKKFVLPEDVQKAVIELGGKGRFPVKNQNGKQHTLIIENHVVKSVT